MKKINKYILYISAPVISVGAVLIYNSISTKVEVNESNTGSQQIRPAATEGRGGGRSLPVSFYVADFGEGADGLLRLGTLVARERVDIVSEMSGRVVTINFQEGQSVSKGEVLVSLNDDELQAQLRRTEYQYQLSGQRLERQKILLSKDAVSREDYDQVLTEYNMLRQDIEQLKVKIEKSKVRAPFDGVLGFREISEGAFLQPNSKISTLVDVKNLVVEFSVPEKYVSSKLAGSKALFSVEGISRSFEAEVYAVEPQIDVKTRTIMLRARYQNRDGLLRPGMSAKVVMNPQRREATLFIPNEAIIPDVMGRSVWVINGGKAKKLVVQTGNRSADKIEVLSGISVGDSVIVSGLMQLREGMSVKPTRSY